MSSTLQLLFSVLHSNWQLFSLLPISPSFPAQPSAWRVVPPLKAWAAWLYLFWPTLELRIFSELGGGQSWTSQVRMLIFYEILERLMGVVVRFLLHFPMNPTCRQAGVSEETSKALLQFYSKKLRTVLDAAAQPILSNALSCCWWKSVGGVTSHGGEHPSSLPALVLLLCFGCDENLPRPKSHSMFAFSQVQVRHLI